MTEGSREPSSTPPPEHLSASDAGAAQESADPPKRTTDQRERSGPLLVERHRKADGRRLILYEAVADDG
jgi:hypothetical protein